MGNGCRMKMSRFADFSPAAMHGIPAVDGRGSLHPPISLSLALSLRLSESAKRQRFPKVPRNNHQGGTASEERGDGVGEGEEASFRYATLRAITDWPTKPVRRV